MRFHGATLWLADCNAGAVGAGNRQHAERRTTRMENEWVWEREAALEGKYANCFHVGYNSLEVLIEFGQCHAGEASLLHTRIILQPSFCVELISMLRKCVEQYEQQHGEIEQRKETGMNGPRQ
jgi:hypothetical protein